MAYAVAGQVRDFKLAGYPDKKPMVPHGLSVVINAPAVFRWTASANPERHLEAARALGADVRGATPRDAGELVAKTLEQLMRETKLPIGLTALGYSSHDVEPLVKGTAVQRRLLDNAPLEVREPELTALFQRAMT
jgi:alcohol dehydrogenase class IV